MNEPEPKPSGPSPEERRKDRRLFALWCVAVGLFLLTGLFCWRFLAPYLQVRHALKNWYFVGDSMFVDFYDRQADEVIVKLGGREAAVPKLALYLRLSRRIAPRRDVAVCLLGRCGEAAAPRLRDLLNDDEVGEQAGRMLNDLEASRRDERPR